jgi:hypothetical protein
MFNPTGIFGVVAGLVLLAAPASADVVGGLDIVAACHEQYGSTWAAAHSGNGAYDWYCVNSDNGNTGGLNLDAYCATTYGPNTFAVSNGGLYDWTCNN